MIGGIGLPVSGSAPMSAMKFVLYAALTVTSQPSVRPLSRRTSTRLSTPRFTTEPRFSNRVALAPTDGATMRAMSASRVSLL